MRIQIAIFLFLITPIAYGQYMSGKIDPKAIQANGVISCTEWNNGQEEITFFFNEHGKISYYHFKSVMVDSLGNHIETNNGLRRFEYDKKGNEILNEMSELLPELDSVIIYNQKKSYYDSQNKLIREESFDGPSLTHRPSIKYFFYLDNLLSHTKLIYPKNRLRSSSDSTVFVYKEVVYEYDSLKRLSKEIHYRENGQREGTLEAQYSLNAVTWTYNGFNQSESVSQALYDENNVLVEVVRDNETSVRWHYKDNGLLEKMEELYIPTNTKRIVLFTYEFKK